MADLPSVPSAPALACVPGLAKPTGHGAKEPLDAPSVRVVRQALDLGGRMTAADLHGACALPRRTIYRALQILRDGGLLRQRGSLHDTRQTYFWLARAGPDPPARTASLPRTASPGPSGHLQAVRTAPPATPVP